MGPLIRIGTTSCRREERIYCKRLTRTRFREEPGFVMIHMNTGSCLLLKPSGSVRIWITRSGLVSLTMRCVRMNERQREGGAVCPEKEYRKWNDCEGLLFWP